MKKGLFIITGTFLLVLIILVLILIGIRSQNKLLSDINAEYEIYANREIYGSELVTLINKAVDNNKIRQISRDNNGFYLDNGKDSILIKVRVAGMKDSIEMEKIFSLGTEQFINLYNSELFITEEITYHEQTGRIATMSFKQIEK